MNEFKKCSRCKVIKNIYEFWTNKSKHDGLCTECKVCKYLYYKENKDRFFPRITCSCGKTIYKFYLKDHLQRIHKNASLQ